MGFYAPAQLIQDVRRHGVEVRPVDIRYSGWESHLEVCGKHQQPAIRLGLQRVKGLKRVIAERIITVRAVKAFGSVEDIAEQCRVGREELEILAAAGALAALSGDRHLAHWRVAGIEKELPLFGQPRFNEAVPLIAKLSESENVLADYQSTGLTLRRHPVSLLRQALFEPGVCTAEQICERRNGSIVRVAGLVVNRQRPGTASGVIFVTLEDETGLANLIVWPKIAQAQRLPLLSAKLMLVSGIVQKEHDVVHVVVGKIQDYSAHLANLPIKARDFH